MESKSEHGKLTVNISEAFHPYEDKSLRHSQPELPTLNQREPFNDVVKHGDIVAGYQRNRTLSDYPKRTRPFVRIYAIVALLVVVGGVIWSIISSMHLV